MNLPSSGQPDSLERRKLLATLGALGLMGGAGMTGMLAPRLARATEWQNWSGGQHASPAKIIYPANETELAAAVRDASGSIRAVGGGHSFSPVVPTTGTLISLEAMNGLAGHDAAALTATFWAGTRIAMTGPLLKAVGQGLLNEADINTQSLGGAVSTSTHGTGRQLQSFSGTVKGLQLVLADGSLVPCSADHDADLFQAARVAVGSIGIMSRITVQNREAYRLRENVTIMPITEAMSTIDRDKDKHRHIELWAFPFGGKAILKRQDITTDAITVPEKPFIDENAILGFAANTTRKMPWTNSLFQHLLGAFVSDSERVGNSFEIFPSLRTVQFNEMEYSVPAEHGLACLQEVMDVLKKNDVNVFFPIEFRYVAADDCWLSPFYQRATAAISVHQYYKQDYREVFDLVEPVFWKYQGRPHWGKLHRLEARQLRALYPRFEDFLRVRQRVDANGRFLNPHARKLFLG
ncbi:MAG: D-arabinono-1,4-lactone oxidase [bacterium]|nr:D-arabinono-1,4-lactone oxidase [bacterium]